jgi:hypothetical protein
MRTKLNWYAAAFILALVMAAILLIVDGTDSWSPARTTVPMEKNPEFKPSPENETPIGEEGGPYK